MRKAKSIKLFTSELKTVIEEKNCEIAHIDTNIYDIYKLNEGEKESKLIMRIHKGDDMCLIIKYRD